MYYNVYTARTVKHCRGPMNAGGVDVTDFNIEGQHMMVEDVPA